MRLQKCLMLVCLWVIFAVAPAANAQEPTVEFIDLPSSLPSDHLRNTPLYPDSEPLAQSRRVVLSPAVFAGLANHPRRPLELRARQSAQELEKRRGQYVRCILKNGKVLVGSVSSAGDKSFVLETGLFKSEEISYDSLDSDPVPTGAGGQKFARSMEITGLIAVMIVLSPIIIPAMLIAFPNGGS